MRRRRRQDEAEDDAMAVPNAAGTTTLRDSWQPRILDTLLLSGFMILLILSSDGAAATVFMVVGVLILLGSLYRLVRPVAVLTPTEILVNNMRPRKIPWAGIQNVTSEKALGSRRIVLVLDDGSRVAMEAPRASFISPRGRFDNALETIRRQWVAQRGPDWSAAAAPVDPAQSAEGQPG